MHCMDKIKSFKELQQVVHNYHHACKGLYYIVLPLVSQRIGQPTCLQ
jgi:hypothetical protein